MRKTRAHPPTDRRTEDLKRLRREFRWAHRELDDAGAPRVNDGIELSIGGRIRVLASTIRLLASSAVPLDGVHSSGAAVSAPSVESSTAGRVEHVVDGSTVRADVHADAGQVDSRPSGDGRDVPSRDDRGARSFGVTTPPRVDEPARTTSRRPGG
jgi:hypothetical protein